MEESQEKCCGICMEKVTHKVGKSARRFGILEGCNHIFCLDCIRRWRSSKQFNSKTIRSCPECRTTSNFVIPSKYWVEDCEDKKKLIVAYKEALKTIPCKYFKQGQGKCPFADCCFYKHAYPDGRLAVLGKPRKKKHRPTLERDAIPLFAVLLNLIEVDDFESISSSHADSYWNALFDSLPLRHLYQPSAVRQE